MTHFDKHDRVSVQSFQDATVVQDQDGGSDQVRIQFDSGLQVWVSASMLELVA